MLFNDSKFDKLDDLAKIIEPFETVENDILRLIPDKIDVTNIISKKIYIYSIPELPNIHEVLATAIPGYKQLDNSTLSKKIDYCIEPDSNGDMCIDCTDMQNISLRGKIFIIKKQNHSDEDIKKMISEDIKETFRRSREFMKANKQRINEVANMFDMKHDSLKGLKTSSRDKVHKFGELLAQKFDECDYKIRDLEMSRKINSWICTYFLSDDLTVIDNCIFNITQIAILISNKTAIYGLDEERSIQ